MRSGVATHFASAPPEKLVHGIPVDLIRRYELSLDRHFPTVGSGNATIQCGSVAETQVRIHLPTGPVHPLENVNSLFSCNWNQSGERKYPCHLEIVHSSPRSS